MAAFSPIDCRAPAPHLSRPQGRRARAGDREPWQPAAVRWRSTAPDADANLLFAVDPPVLELPADSATFVKVKLRAALPFRKGTAMTGCSRSRGRGGGRRTVRRRPPLGRGRRDDGAGADHPPLGASSRAVGIARAGAAGPVLVRRREARRRVGGQRGGSRGRRRRLAADRRSRRGRGCEGRPPAGLPVGRPRRTPRPAARTSPRASPRAPGRPRPSTAGCSSPRPASPTSRCRRASTLQVTDIVLQNPTGDTGSLQIRRNGTPLLVVELATSATSTTTSSPPSSSPPARSSSSPRRAPPAPAPPAPTSPATSSRRLIRVPARRRPCRASSPSSCRPALAALVPPPPTRPAPSIALARPGSPPPHRAPGRSP